MNTVRALPTASADDTLPDIAPLKACAGVPADETLVEVAPLAPHGRPHTPDISDQPESAKRRTWNVRAFPLSLQVPRSKLSRALPCDDAASWHGWYPLCRIALEF